MKKLKYFALAILSFTLLNCSNEDDNGQVAYKGGAALNFLDQGAEEQLFVVSNTEYGESVVKFGSLNPVSGSHTVKLVPDVNNSSAILGEDYIIIDDTVELADGDVSGEFTVRFFKDKATEVGKTVVFKLESSLPAASFYTSHTINVNLSCPVEVLVGNFTSSTYWYGGPGVNTVHDIQQIGTTQLIIKDFFRDNNGTSRSSDFVLSYNKSTFVVTFPGIFTGRFNGSTQIVARPTAGKISNFDPCKRIVTLYVTYTGTPQGTVNAEEIFTGIDLPTPEEPEVP